MKRLQYIFLVVLCAVAVSCHGDLNVEQKSEFTSVSMWKSESDAVSAVNGVYSQLRAALSTSLPVYGDYRSALYGGGMMSNKDYDKMSANVITMDMEGTDWSSIYTTINSCNLILKYTQSIAFNSESTRNEVLVNAYFVRAYCYFLIARVWGDAPVLTSGFESDKQEDLYPFRESVSKVYELVESDINNALALVTPSMVSKKKASLASVNMLAADYYLWKAKRLSGGNEALTAAKRAVDNVLGAPGYGLEENFANIFGVENEGSKEIIFSFNYERDEYVGGYPSMYLAPEQYVENKELINNPVPIGSHQQYVSITDEYEAFLGSDPADTRKDVSFGVCQDGTTRWRWINKYKGEWISETRYFSSDIIVYRFAEAVLMKAEVENALGNSSDAQKELLKIEKRAYGTEKKYAGALSKDAIDNAIVEETLKEFVGEAKSWWTIVRFGQAFTRIASLKGREGEKNILLWPVSSNCINTNPNIAQTEGYDK